MKRSDGTANAKTKKTDGERSDDAPDNLTKHRKLSKRQFGLRRLFYAVLVVAILVGSLREDIVRRPIWLLGALIIGLFFAAVEGSFMRLFDAFLWRVFSDKNDGDDSTGQ